MKKHQSILKILIADDDPRFIKDVIEPALSSEPKNKWTQQALSDVDINITCVTSQVEAICKLLQCGEDFEIVLLDQRLRDSASDPMDKDMLGGLKVQQTITERQLRPKTILMTGDSTPRSVRTAFDAIIQQGVFSYLFKGDDDSFQRQLLLAIRMAWEHIRIQREAVEAQGLIGDSLAMERVKDMINRASQADVGILLTGESGTGKEVVAKAIHHRSKRQRGVFMPINCSTIPRELLENELFGHEAGAFADAHTQSVGKFEAADGGTIFLDEIAEMPYALQAKLLRCLQEHTFQRLGGTNEIHSDVRVIAATNADMDQQVREGNFRQDLYYRLNVIRIELPPLRQRKEDIPLLVRHFIHDLRDECHNTTTHDVSEKGLEVLMNHKWPGNVRELQNIIRRAMVWSECPILDVNEIREAVRSYSLLLPEDVKKMIDHRLCQAFNEWSKQEKGAARTVATNDIMEILGVAHQEGKVSPKVCKENIGLEHTKASRVLEFLATHGFLSQSGPGVYVLGQKFNAHA